MSFDGQTKNISFMGQVWGEAPTPDPSDVRALQRAGCNAQLAHVLANRDFQPEDLDLYFNTKVSRTHPHPYKFKDMEVGVKRVAEAIRGKKRIGIWSDYDVDGNASAALLVTFLKMCGHDDVFLYIPDREKEGYGPNTPGMLKMRSEHGCDVVCVLDAGILAFEPLAACHEAGIDVVVIDHHLGGDELPKAVAIINANRKDEEPGFENLCAGGMTLVFCVGLSLELKSTQFFDGKEGRPDQHPDMMELTDLAALATCCDMVPLTGFNRAIVIAGLKRLSQRARPGIAALAAAFGLNPRDPIGAGECGWKLGPAVNAGGRISESDLGAKLLIETDEVEAQTRARQLASINEKRKAMSNDACEKALQICGDRAPGDRSLVLVTVPDIHEGIVGLAASKVMNRFFTPTIVLTNVTDEETGETFLKGSARSLDGFNMGEAFHAASEAGLLVKGGGHGKAAGLTLRPDQLDGFRDFMNERVNASEWMKTGYQITPDLVITPRDVSVQLIEEFKKMEPFGMGNEEPLFMVKDAVVQDIMQMGAKKAKDGKDRHVKLKLAQGNVTFDALLFNVLGTPLGDQILQTRGRTIEVLGKLSVNEFRGNKSAQMMVDDLRYAEGALL